jgi:hypothetical protein
MASWEPPPKPKRPLRPEYAEDPVTFPRSHTIAGVFIAACCFAVGLLLYFGGRVLSWWWRFSLAPYISVQTIEHIDDGTVDGHGSVNLWADDTLKIRDETGKLVAEIHAATPRRLKVTIFSERAS